MHEVETCVFCSKRVRYGHMKDDALVEMILVHDTPSCPEFKLCDSVSEFAMMTMLKLKSDIDQRERN